ncbi:SDR family NAD(P)-dependent oxidoreductase [Arthrobacter sp. EPSL27]|uniref:SDR family NAD(P)-dependent oxidoreductase n=1 Tax=Arthrobacter sp. EPSL27 TaxID=1745378 RepID=UPI0009EA6535|nr:SDR family NAD(P)-dependent oxidoreductase [Arthrobacter sp. EPSL27]
MSTRLQGKIALVVGAGSSAPGMGNGKATAIAFAREGATVVCADVNEAAAKETERLILEEGGAARHLAFDVTDSAAVGRAVAGIIDEFGRIDVLDNNVGIARVGGVVELDEAEWDRVHAINLKGPFLTMKHVIPHMVAQGGGSIINISSLAGIRWTGVPYSTYYSSKAALNHLSRTTAAEYAAKHVRVNAILPGLMETPMVTESAELAGAYADGQREEMLRKRHAQVPMGHMGTAWDVANAAVFLASDESAYVTGIELRVDGGISLGF